MHPPVHHDMQLPEHVPTHVFMHIPEHPNIHPIGVGVFALIKVGEKESKITPKIGNAPFAAFLKNSRLD